MLDFSSLNQNQLEAVQWHGSPLLVLAGPGSGKTRVLTVRVARLLADSPHKRFRVLALTFTSKAAGEMRERVEQLVPDLHQRAWMTTFHAFAAEVLRQHGTHVGLRPDFAILTQEADRQAVLRDAVRETRSKGFDIDDEERSLLSLIDHRFARGFGEAYDENGFPLPEWFPCLFDEYQRQLLQANRTDFASLLWLCHRILEERPAIARQFRMIYPHICIDEFQDTNLAQYRLIQAIVGPALTDLFVVADDDQIVYQWNGASPERLQALRDAYGMHVVQLPQNYRCPAEVIHLANSLIRHNQQRAADKRPLEAMRLPGACGHVRLLAFDDPESETSWVARDLESRGFEPTSCVVIARTNKFLEAAADALRQSGVPAQVMRRKSEFESTPFRWLHAGLRLANARHDPEQLRRLCKSWFELVGVDLRPSEIEAAATLLGGDFLRAWIDEAERAKKGLEILRGLRDQLLDRIDFLSFTDGALSWFLGLQKALVGQDGAEGFADYDDERARWEQLQFDIVRRFGRAEVSLHQFLQELDLESKTAVLDSAVRCMTIHGAKGLEFGHVYLIGMVEDLLPSFQAKKRGDASREMEEERRNCFVAITRVQSTLTMTFARKYNGWPKQPSRFLREMGLDPSLALGANPSLPGDRLAARSNL